MYPQMVYVVTMIVDGQCTAAAYTSFARSFWFLAFLGEVSWKNFLGAFSRKIVFLTAFSLELWGGGGAIMQCWLTSFRPML